MWPQCGMRADFDPWDWSCRGLCRNANTAPRAALNGYSAVRSTGVILATRPLTMTRPQDYISPLDAPPRLVRLRVCEAPHCLRGESSGLTHGPVGCMGFGGSGACRRRDPKVPGCLKSESEERETWTAESLRAASSNGEGFGFVREENAAVEETSAVDVSGQHYDRDGEQSPERTEWDLVKRCDLPRSNLFNLRV